jgi:hypothetical protein
MSKLNGIETRKNTQGKITHITIDVKILPEVANPILEQAGLKEKMTFEQEWEEAKIIGFTVEEARASTLAKVRALPWKK